MVTSNNKLQVLIVTSNSTARQRLRDGLPSFNCDVMLALDGESAMLILKQKRMDAVVASTELHGMSGIQLSRAVTRIYPSMPVVMMSPIPDAAQVAQALGSGACDLVGETMSAEELYNVIVRNMERKTAAGRRILTDRADVLYKAIKAVTAAIDAKSLHAARHSGRVVQICLHVAERLPLTQQQMATLELAAQMHDIGKIGTPDAVLSKPDMLTDEEWVDVLKHPALSGAFLAQIPELAEVATIVRHHHEHFDGTGYPDGLQGEAIPLLSRLLAVADAYDAMTNERPYRKALSHDAAIEELKSHSGTQFDPTMVDHFIAALAGDTSERKAA